VPTQKETVRCELTVNSAQDQNTNAEKTPQRMLIQLPEQKLYTQKAAHHIAKYRQVDVSLRHAAQCKVDS
jgi:hypothetical protein